MTSSRPSNTPTPEMEGVPLLAGRSAVVTGAANGLGLAIARAFSEHGASVLIADRDQESSTSAAATLRGPSAGIACDVTAPADVERAAAAAREQYGALDIWVNNAGFTRDATLRKMPVEDFDAVIAVHLRGAWLGIRAAAAVMRDQARGGTIVNMSSISGKVGNPGQTNYSAAKAGVVGMTKAAAKELGFAGIRVNALMPGLIETAMTRAMPEDVRESRLRDVPLGRFGRADEVAGAALFLASDLSSYVTGSVVEISGGRNL